MNRTRCCGLRTSQMSRTPTVGGHGETTMNRISAALLAIVLGGAFAVGAPLVAAMWVLLVPVIASSGVWQDSAAMATVAVPVIYLMLRRMQ